MGLDMYVLAVDAKIVTKDTFSYDESKSVEVLSSEGEIFYWRKHPDLHIWFRDLFYRKGGYRDSEFNGDCVRITLEDLDRLEEEIRDDTLSTTRSKIWSESYYRLETIDTDLIFIKKAREALADNKALYYTSSW